MIFSILTKKRLLRWYAGDADILCIYKSLSTAALTYLQFVEIYRRLSFQKTAVTIVSEQNGAAFR